MNHNWKDALEWHAMADFCYTPERLARLVAEALSDDIACGHAKGYRTHYAIRAALEAMIANDVHSAEEAAQ